MKSTWFFSSNATSTWESGLPLSVTSIYKSLTDWPLAEPKKKTIKTQPNNLSGTNLRQELIVVKTVFGTQKLEKKSYKKGDADGRSENYFN
jgi:hypothetical protein